MAASEQLRKAQPLLLPAVDLAQKDLGLLCEVTLRAIEPMNSPFPEIFIRGASIAMERHTRRILLSLGALAYMHGTRCRPDGTVDTSKGAKTLEDYIADARADVRTLTAEIVAKALRGGFELPQWLPREFPDFMAGRAVHTLRTLGSTCQRMGTNEVAEPDIHERTTKPIAK